MMNVLVADDDPNTRYLVEVFMKRLRGIALHFVSNGQAALEMVRAGEIDAVVADIHMPVMSGDQLLVAIKEHFPALPVLIMTGHGSIEDAVDFLQRGADDYLAKPLTKDVFLHRLQRVLDGVQLTRELSKLRGTLSSEISLIGRSPPMLALTSRIPTIAQTEASVVVFGESGTGKEVVARAIHAQSRRADRAFVTVNCGSLPETLLESELFGYKKGAFTGAAADTAGLVEEAHTGTLFLDEIGEISLAVQVKLLRFLQSKEYKPLGSPKSRIADVRIIAATNRDLRQAVVDGTFREDLYYRLNIIPIELAPLRERRDDIIPLATHFLERANKKFNKAIVVRSPEVFRRLEGHVWPGNVRELENKIEQLAVMAMDDVIRPEDVRLDDGPISRPLFEERLSKAPSQAASPIGRFKDEKRATIETFEQEYLQRLLKAENGHVTRAAKRAGMDRKNLWQLMRKHGLDAERFKTRPTEI